jgi:hypothetical protein
MTELFENVDFKLTPKGLAVETELNKKILLEKTKVYKFDFSALFQRYWLWQAVNPDKVREEWPEWQPNGGDVLYALMTDCFACEAALSRMHHKYVNAQDAGENPSDDMYKDYCGECPVFMTPCEEQGSIYQRWVAAEGVEKEKLAVEIANLKWHGDTDYML